MEPFLRVDSHTRQRKILTHFRKNYDKRALTREITREIVKGDKIKKFSLKDKYLLCFILLILLRDKSLSKNLHIS